MKKLTIITMLMLFILVLSVNAAIVDQHPRIGKDALERTTNSPITQQIMQYEDYYHVCNELVDISVVNYFQPDTDEDAGFWEKLWAIFKFRIGKPYTATHSQVACTRALSVAQNDKEEVCGYGICTHLMIDSPFHNIAVPQAIAQTGLFNGLVHSIKEIRDKDLMTTHADYVYSRQILDLGYEMSDYFERVFVEDPAFAEINIPALMDFFIKQVQPEAEYRLGFRSFFALPSYIYWILFIGFFLSLALLAYVVREIREGVKNAGTIFTMFIGLIILGLFSTAIYGLFAGNIWAIWEWLSQILFSPASYAIGIGLIILSLGLGFLWISRKEKIKNISTLFVTIFLLLIGSYIVTLPTALDTGNEEQIHELAVQNTVDLLNDGVNAIRLIDDPSGYASLKEADEKGRARRAAFMLTLIALVIAILFFAFKPIKKKKQ